MKLHEGPITGIIQILNVYSSITQKNMNILVVSSADKILSVISLFKFLKITDKFV
jgi:hypothetical protein